MERRDNLGLSAVEGSPAASGFASKALLVYTGTARRAWHHSL
jgi:hypothetical protein